jgi:hypothetical protein
VIYPPVQPRLQPTVCCGLLSCRLVCVAEKNIRTGHRINFEQSKAVYTLMYDDDDDDNDNNNNNLNTVRC